LAILALKVTLAVWVTFSTHCGYEILLEFVCAVEPSHGRSACSKIVCKQFHTIWQHVLKGVGLATFSPGGPVAAEDAFPLALRGLRDITWM
jgi:hypothetical protein